MEIGLNINMVIIEATCKKCLDEYIYLPVPIYVIFAIFFLLKPSCSISIFTTLIHVKNVIIDDFSFIII